jgi:hypothetical protein
MLLSTRFFLFSLPNRRLRFGGNEQNLLYAVRSDYDNDGGMTVRGE